MVLLDLLLDLLRSDSPDLQALGVLFITIVMGIGAVAVVAVCRLWLPRDRDGLLTARAWRRHAARIVRSPKATVAVVRIYDTDPETIALVISRLRVVVGPTGVGRVSGHLVAVDRVSTTARYLWECLALDVLIDGRAANRQVRVGLTKSEDFGGRLGPMLDRAAELAGVSLSPTPGERQRTR